MFSALNKSVYYGSSKLNNLRDEHEYFEAGVDNVVIYSNSLIMEIILQQSQVKKKSIPSHKILRREYKGIDIIYCHSLVQI